MKKDLELLPSKDMMKVSTMLSSVLRMMLTIQTELRSLIIVVILYRLKELVLLLQ